MPGRPKRRARQMLRDSSATVLPPHKYRRPPLYPKQRDALFHHKRYGLLRGVHKGRQDLRVHGMAL